MQITRLPHGYDSDLHTSKTALKHLRLNFFSYSSAIYYSYIYNIYASMCERLSRVRYKWETLSKKSVEITATKRNLC